MGGFLCRGHAALAVTVAIALGPVALSAAAPPPPGADCGSATPSLVPTTADEQTLVGYFEALNARDYPTAWNFLRDAAKSVYGSQQRYAELMAAHVGCVRLLGVKPHGAHAYLVDLAAQYVTPFPAGSGALPAFWTVEDGAIVEFGTGPPG